MIILLVLFHYRNHCYGNKDYGIYFSILTLIAQGKNTRSELENALNIKELSDYFKNLSIEDM